MKKKVLLAIAIGFAICCMRVFAHHGTGIAYDNSKPTVLNGTVTEFGWKNPHAHLFLDVKEANGNMTKWAVEMNSPGVMTRQGWTRRQFKVGDQVTITVYPSKAGTNFGSCIGQCKCIINGKDVTPKPPTPGEQF